MSAEKTGGPVVCMLACNGVMAYFFYTYWAKNPDQYGSTGYVKGATTYDCWAGSIMKNQPNNWSNTGGKGTPYSDNVTANFLFWF